MLLLILLITLIAISDLLTYYNVNTCSRSALVGGGCGCFLAPLRSRRCFRTQHVITTTKTTMSTNPPMTQPMMMYVVWESSSHPLPSGWRDWPLSQVKHFTDVITVLQFVHREMASLHCWHVALSQYSSVRHRSQLLLTFDIGCGDEEMLLLLLDSNKVTVDWA